MKRLLTVLALVAAAFVVEASPRPTSAASDAPVAAPTFAGGPKSPQHLKVFRTPERRPGHAA